MLRVLASLPDISNNYDYKDHILLASLLFAPVCNIDYYNAKMYGDTGTVLK